MKLFFAFAIASVLFFGCSYGEENDYEQTVINNSSYNVEVNGVLVSSGKVATFEISMSADDSDEFLKITSNDYPRVKMERNAISFHRYQYTISDYEDSFKYYDTETNQEQKYVYKCKQVTIVNASSKDIKVFNPYFYSKYDEEKCYITVEAGKEKSSEIVFATSDESGTTVVTYSQAEEESFNLYNDYTDFTAVYDESNTACDVSVEPTLKYNGHTISYKVIVK